MFFEVIVKGQATPSSSCWAWDFVPVPRRKRNARVRHTPACRHPGVADLLQRRRRKPRRTNPATTSCNNLRRKRPTHAVVLPFATVGQPDQRQLMTGYCNAALRRRRRWEPKPPPPTYRKSCPSGNPRRRVSSATRRCQTTRVFRIPNLPALTNQTQLVLRGNTRGAQHRRETTLQFGAQPPGVAVVRRNVYGSPGP